MATLKNNDQIYMTFENEAECLLNLLFLACNNSFNFLIDLENQQVFFEGLNFTIEKSD